MVQGSERINAFGSNVTGLEALDNVRFEQDRDKGRLARHSECRRIDIRIGVRTGIAEVGQKPGFRQWDDGKSRWHSLEASL